MMIRIARRLLSVAATTSQNGLPWTVVKPYGSIRVNLTEAYKDGWIETEDFPDQLKSMKFSSTFQHHVVTFFLFMKGMLKSGR